MDQYSSILVKKVHLPYLRRNEAVMSCLMPPHFHVTQMQRVCIISLIWLHAIGFKEYCCPVHGSSSHLPAWLVGISMELLLLGYFNWHTCSCSHCLPALPHTHNVSITGVTQWSLFTHILGIMPPDLIGIMGITVIGINNGIGVGNTHQLINNTRSINTIKMHQNVLFVLPKRTTKYQVV